MSCFNIKLPTFRALVRFTFLHINLFFVIGPSTVSKIYLQDYAREPTLSEMYSTQRGGIKAHDESHTIDGRTDLLYCRLSPRAELDRTHFCVPV